MTPQILLMSGNGFVSKLIKFQSWGDVSHAAILLEQDLLVEAWQGKGVRYKIIQDWKNVRRFEITQPFSELELRLFISKQIGKKYDYRGVARFLTRNDTEKENEKWFCSELVFKAFEIAGLKLLERIPPARVSPQQLLYSPYLKEI